MRYTKDVAFIPVADCLPCPDNPRPEGEASNELFQSVAQTGQHAPIVVTEHGTHFNVVDGRKRVRVFRDLGWLFIVARVAERPAVEAYYQTIKRRQ